MRMKKFYKKVLLIISSVVALLMPSILFAQDFPCGGTDPYATCPLDTWVLVLAGTVLLFAAIHLYKKQKSVSK